MLLAEVQDLIAELVCPFILNGLMMLAIHQIGMRLVKKRVEIVLHFDPLLYRGSLPTTTVGFINLKLVSHFVTGHK